jgi:hypothetical protein
MYKQESAEVPANIHTFANGDGIWHADVPETAASPIMAARRAIRAELYLRSAGTPELLATLSEYTRKHVRRVEGAPAGFVRFAEV